MSTATTKWNETVAAYELRKRRRWRILAYAITGILLLSIIADHLRAQNRHGDDWLRFDGQQVQFVKSVGGQSIAVRDENTEDMTIIALQGIRSAGADWDRISAERLDSLLTGKKVTLHLKPTDPRDQQSRLRADVFLDDRTLVSSELAGEGLVLADRASGCDFISAIDQAQARAKHHHLGLWADAR
jgi:endonuclease YncB( thermonuclease family)